MSGERSIRRSAHAAGSRRGFTLLESLMAAGILFVIVIAVTSAVTAGQHNAYEAQQRISGTLAAEDLMGRLLMVPYEDLPSAAGTEQPGTMTDAWGDPMPASFGAIGRSVDVVDSVTLSPNSSVKVLGRIVRVTTFDVQERTLADLRRFVPYPSAALIGEASEELLSGLNSLEMQALE